ncbi:hypothetical protein Tco_1105115 [Tanacetum coccineum]
MIVKREATDDLDEVYDMLKYLREDMIAENDKLIGVNQFVADAEEDIDMKEGVWLNGVDGSRKVQSHSHPVANWRALFIKELDILGVRHVPAKFAEFLKEIQAKDRETMAN